MSGWIVAGAVMAAGTATWFLACAVCGARLQPKYRDRMERMGLLMNDHFTAWVTNDRSCLADDISDVVVLRDEERIDWQAGDEERLRWLSVGSPIFHALTGVRYDAGPQDQLDAARIALRDSGWQISGAMDWVGVPTGWAVTVTRG